MVRMSEIFCIYAMAHPKMMNQPFPIPPAPDSLQEIRQHVGASFSPHGFLPNYEGFSH